MDDPRRRIVEVRFSPRNLIVSALSLLLVVVGVWAVLRAEQVILWTLLAVLIAGGLDPVVSRIERHLRIGRAGAALMVMTGIFGALVGLGILFVPRLIDGVRVLADGLPGIVERFSGSALGMRLSDWGISLDAIGAHMGDWLTGIADPGTAVSLAGQVGGIVFGALSITVIAFCLLIYGRGFREWAIGEMPAHLRARARLVSGHMHRVTSGYMVGLMVTGVISLTLSAIVFTVLGMPAAFVLATWQALCVLIPIVGALLGAIPAVIVAFTISPTVGIGVIIFIAVYQQIENHVVTPMVMRRAVRLNPLLVLISILIGIAMFGFIGALIAVPVAGALQVAARDLWRQGLPRPHDETT